MQTKQTEALKRQTEGYDLLIERAKASGKSADGLRDSKTKSYNRNQ